MVRKATHQTRSARPLQSAKRAGNRPVWCAQVANRSDPGCFGTASRQSMTWRFFVAPPLPLACPSVPTRFRNEANRLSGSAPFCSKMQANILMIFKTRTASNPAPPFLSLTPHGAVSSNRCAQTARGRHQRDSIFVKPSASAAASGIERAPPASSASDPSL